MENVKIGVGVITTGLREIHPNIFSLSESEVFIYTDSDRQGPAIARNKVLAHFEDYDYVFIFDDDCYPRHKGYEQFFIKESKKHDLHWMGFPDAFGDTFSGSNGTLSYWRELYGPFQFFSRKALEVIGGYNPAYHKYGWEDIGIARRAIRAGLTGNIKDLYAFPLLGLSYIHPMDHFGNDVLHYSPEEKQVLAESNKQTFLAELKDSKLYYPFV